MNRTNRLKKLESSLEARRWNGDVRSMPDSDLERFIRQSSGLPDDAELTDEFPLKIIAEGES